MSNTNFSPIAFIGLGKMGLPMALQLASKAFTVQGFDLSEAALDALAAGGGKPCRSIKEAVHGSDVVIMMLPDSKAVESVALSGPAALISEMLPQSLLIDMSSSSPSHTQEIGKRFSEANIGMVDAPVSGGVRRAKDGSLSIMAGGTPAAVARARPILQSLGRTIFETGPLGSGHAMKALNNFVSAAGLAAACEALQIGTRFGLDATLMTDVLNASTGRNNSTENKLKQFVISESYDGGFSLGLMAKDVGIAAELADDVSSSAPVCHETARLWKSALEKLGPASDHTAIDVYLKGL